METETLGIGIVGLGFMGRTHLAAWSRAAAEGRPCRVVAVCDRDPARKLEQAARGNLDLDRNTQPVKTSDIRPYRVFDELLADPDVAAISLCTWTDTHVELALAALRAGKHVLVEKPLARSTAEARPLVEAARSAGPLCMPAMCMRFWPGWRWLIERVREQTFGPLRAITLSRIGSMPDWSCFYADRSRSGGALLDLHIHDVDFLCALFGPPRRVQAWGDVDHVVATYGFANGPPVAVAEGCWDAAAGYPFRMAYRAHFAHATAEYDNRRDRPLWLARDGVFEPLELSPGTGYDHQVRHFLDAILGRTPPAITPDDALAALRVIEQERELLERL